MRWVTRIVIHVPELCGVFMTYDRSPEVVKRYWRPLGGGSTPFDTDWRSTGVRETREEGGFIITPEQVTYINESTSPGGHQIYLGYAEISAEEAKWVQPETAESEDVVAFLTYEEARLPQYRGIPIHSGYQASMFNGPLAHV